MKKKKSKKKLRLNTGSFPIILPKNKKPKLKSTAKSITETDGEHTNWYSDARHQTLQTLPKFLNHIANDYAHDYGTICHAICAAALGAATAVDSSSQGGITGFQASAVMWEFIKQWRNTDNPMILVDFGNMLYPQYEGDFKKTITPKTAEWLKKTAQKYIDDKDQLFPPHPKVLAHWKNLASGKLPFGYTIKK